MRSLVYMLIVAFSTQLHAAQGIPAVPQIPAFLPMAHTVPQSQTTPIDGEWVITSIGKRIRIQAGRAYAIDSWAHLFVLKINPMMVVIKDITRTGPGEYSGQDLPLMGAWQARLATDGNLNVTVRTALGPIRYALMPVRADDQAAFENERRGRDYQPQPAAEQPERYYEPDSEDVYEDDLVSEDESADWDGW